MKGQKKQSHRYTTYLLLLLALIGTQFFMGCRHFQIQYVVDPILLNSKLTAVEGSNGTFHDDFYKDVPVVKIPLMDRGLRGKLTQINPDGEAFKDLYKRAKDTDVKKIEDAKAARNEIITRMMLLSDGHYQWHKAAKEANKTVFQMTTRGTSLFLSGLASAVGGESFKAALAAGSTFGNALSTLGSEEIFYKRLVIAIIRKMDEERERLKKEIAENMGKPVTKYSVNTAIIDAIAYHNAGSFIKGLEIVTRAVESSEMKDPNTLATIQLQIAANDVLLADLSICK